MTNIIVALFLLGIGLPTIHSRQVLFYRNDYTYIEEFDAFYKVHWDISGSAWSTALFTCDGEGAILFYPKAKKEWTIVRNLTDKIDKEQRHNVTDIFVGLHDEFKMRQYITDDEDPTADPVYSDGELWPQQHRDNCMSMNIDTGLFKMSSCLRTPQTELPFVCKKINDESCPTIDHGYKYMKASKKCYKVNEKPLMWEQAMKTCFLEGGILAVIENSIQAQDIKSTLKTGPSYFVGVRRLDSREDFYSVKGQKFSDMYQRQYSSSSPFDCGIVNIQNGMLYTQTLNCLDTAPFVCEMNVDH